MREDWADRGWERETEYHDLVSQRRDPWIDPPLRVGTFAGRRRPTAKKSMKEPEARTSWPRRHSQAVHLRIVVQSRKCLSAGSQQESPYLDFSTFQKTPKKKEGEHALRAMLQLLLRWETGRGPYSVWAKATDKGSDRTDARARFHHRPTRRRSAVAGWRLFFLKNFFIAIICLNSQHYDFNSQ